MAFLRVLFRRVHKLHSRERVKYLASSGSGLVVVLRLFRLEQRPRQFPRPTDRPNNRHGQGAGTRTEKSTGSNPKLATPLYARQRALTPAPRPLTFKAVNVQ